MDNPFFSKMVSPGDASLSRRAATDAPAFFEKLLARSAVDGPVHTPASQSRVVGAVDDGIDIERGDIGLQYAYFSWISEMPVHILNFLPAQFLLF